MRKTWAIIAMLTALCCVSCENEEENAPASCVNGERKCAGNNEISICVNGEFQTTKCGSGMFCSNDSLRCVECDEKTSIASCSFEVGHENSVKYCSDGFWRYTDCGSKLCVSSTYTNDIITTIPAFCQDNGASVAECTAGKSRCTQNGQRQVCGNDGKWGAAVNCPTNTTCQQGDCRAEVACTAGQMQCDGDSNVQSCVNGQWQTTATCDANSGQKCKFSNNKASCITQSWTQCSNIPELADYTSRCAGYGLVCLYDGDESYACTQADACSVNNQHSSECIVDSKEGDYLAMYTCIQADGKFFLAMDDYKECANACNTGKTDCDASGYKGEGGQTQGCTAGTYQCSGQTLQTCSNNAWTAVKTCSGSQVCSASAKDCVDGGSSNPGSWKLCSDYPALADNVKQCQQYGLTCVTDGQSGGCAEANACSVENQKSSSCETDNSGDYLANYLCVKANNSFYLIMEDYQDCANACNTQKTDCDAAGYKDHEEEYYCGNEKYDTTQTIEQYCGSGKVGLCWEDPDEGDVFNCFDACTSAQVSQTKNTCLTVSSGSYQLQMVCKDFSGHSAWMYDYDTASKCSSTCNSQNTGCK